MADEEQVQSSTEETTEAEEETAETEESETSEDASEETESSDEVGDDEEDLEQIRKDAKAFKDQKRRAEKAEARVKELEGKSSQEKGRTPKKDDQFTALEKRTADAEARATRAELAAAGFKHPDDQKYILDAARRLGVEPLEAANDELVAGKLKRMGEARATKENTPAPSGRGGNGKSSTDIGKLADKVSAGGELPTDPALAEKVQKELARRSQARA